MWKVVSQLWCFMMLTERRLLIDTDGLVKAVVIPLLMKWNYNSLALRHRYWYICRYMIAVYNGANADDATGPPSPGRYLTQVKRNRPNVYCIENRTEMYDYIKLKQHVQTICQLMEIFQNWKRYLFSKSGQLIDKGWNINLTGYCYCVKTF